MNCSIHRCNWLKFSQITKTKNKFHFTSIKVIERLGLDLPDVPVRVISALLAFHVGIIPIYCIVQLFRDREDLAKEAAVAGGVFLTGMVGVALIIQNI